MTILGAVPDPKDRDCVRIINLVDDEIRVGRDQFSCAEYQALPTSPGEHTQAVTRKQ